MKHINTLFAAALSILATGAFAQDRVDIGLHQMDNGQLEVRVRPQTDFNGIFSSVVFTLKWDATSGAALGELSQEGPAAAYMPVAPSGGVHEVGGVNYQIYAGFGFSTIASTGVTWEAGKEYVIASIPMQGKGVVELLNDSWTGELTNNGDYYVSLGGQDKTGDIYKSLAVSGDLENTVSIQPNPNNGLFTFGFYAESTSDLQVEVLNTLGQSVYLEVQRGFSGSYRHEMDLTTMSNGIYYLKITLGSGSSVHKIVYR